MKTHQTFASKKLIIAGMIGYLAGLFILLPGKEVKAQRTLPTTDPFEYAAGPLHIVGQDWIRISGTSNDLLVNNGNVTYNGYLGETGRKATMTNGANDDLKLSFVSQSSAGTTIFTAFTMNILNTSGLTASGTYCFILGSGTNNFAARIYIKSSGTGYLMGISKTATAPSSWSALLTAASTHLIVMSYEIKSGSSNDLASLWIDPAITTNQPPPGSTTSAGTDFGGGSAIDGFILRQATGTPNVSLDDISISTSWYDLMKNPVFTVSGSIGSGSFNDITVTGLTTSLNLTGNISIQGTLSLNDAKILLNGNVLSYSTNGTLKYSGNASQTTTAWEFPTINGPKDLIIENPAGVHLDLNRILPGTLTIANGSKFYINSLKSLTVQGNTVLNGIDCLIIQSDAEGTASFIDNGTISGPGTLKAERYLSGYGNQDDLQYHFLSSPVEAQPIQPGFAGDPPDPGSDFYQWNEPGNTWINSKDNNGNWNSGFEPSFILAKGYLVAYPSNEIKYFSGKPNSFPSSSPLVVNCSFTDPGSGGGGGWNLLGNPYPSAVDWNLVNRESGIDNALYYYDATIENYRYFIQCQPGISIGNGSQYIPPMHGFMVHANNTGARILNFDNSARVHEGLNMNYKNSSSRGKILKLKVENEKFSDEAYFSLIDEATFDFDGTFDAYKLFGLNPLVPQIYSLTQDQTKLAVNSFPGIEDNMEIPIGFRPGENGTYEMTADGISDFYKGTRIILKDLKTGETRNLSFNPVYEFTSSSADDPIRFLLRFSLFNGIESPPDKLKIHICYSNKLITVSTDGEFSDGRLFLYNLYGEELFHDRMSERQTLTIPLRSIPGVCLLKVIADGKVYIKKLSVF